MHRDLREPPPRDTRDHPSVGQRRPREEDSLDLLDLAYRRIDAGAESVVDVGHLAPWIGTAPGTAPDLRVVFTAARVAVERAAAEFRWRHRGLVEDMDLPAGPGEVLAPASAGDPTPRSWPVVARSASYAIPWVDVAQIRSGGAPQEIARRLAASARASTTELLHDVDRILVFGGVDGVGARRSRVPGIVDLLGTHRYGAATAEIILRDAGRLIAESPAECERWRRARAVVAGVPEVLAPALSREADGARSPTLEVVVVWRLAGVVPEAGAACG